MGSCSVILTVQRVASPHKSGCSLHVAFYFIKKEGAPIKSKRVFGVILAVALMLTVSLNAAASGRDTSGYGFRSGKAGRIEDAAPYAGMTCGGGEQCNASAYSFRVGRAGKPRKIVVFSLPTLSSPAPE